MANTVKRHEAEEATFDVADDNEDGQPRMTRQRTRREEVRHQNRMDRWAERQAQESW